MAVSAASHRRRDKSGSFRIPKSFARLLAASRRIVAHLPGAIVGVAPHSLRAVSERELTSIVALASDGPIHIHAAEQRREVDDCIAWSGERPVEWILNRQDVNDRWCVIHATHMTAEETEALARTGAVAGLCPITEANLGDGVFNLPLYARAGGRYGVGTDSNVSVGLADELRMLEYAQRLVQRSRNVASAGQSVSTGRALFDAALAGGSRAAGLATVGLEIGAPADIVELDDAHIALAGPKRRRRAQCNDLRGRSRDDPERVGARVQNGERWTASPPGQRGREFSRGDGKALA